ncbi:MAG: glucose uptake protein GlcU [Bacteroidia bacterium]|jgi:glucose uptake protein GlcU
MIPFYGLALIGGIFIAIGFIAKAFPDSIAGYNTMSAEKKKNVDIDGLSTVGRNCMIIAGVSIIVIPTFFRLIHVQVNEVIFLMGIPLVMVSVLLVLSQKYDHNKKTTLEKLFPFVLVLGIFVFVGFKMLKTRESFEVSILDNQIAIP